MGFAPRVAGPICVPPVVQPRRLGRLRRYLGQSPGFNSPEIDAEPGFRHSYLLRTRFVPTRAASMPRMNSITASPSAPATHRHHEVEVPIAAAMEFLEPEFGGDRAAYTWRIAYRCPQCSAQIESSGGADPASGA
jgi:hypothetical protein